MSSYLDQMFPFQQSLASPEGTLKYEMYMNSDVNSTCSKDEHVQKEVASKAERIYIHWLQQTVKPRKSVVACI